jgi:hypothetical protein
VSPYSQTEIGEEDSSEQYFGGNWLWGKKDKRSTKEWICSTISGLSVLSQFLPQEKVQTLRDMSSAMRRYVNESSQKIGDLEKEVQYWKQRAAGTGTGTAVNTEPAGAMPSNGGLNGTNPTEAHEVAAAVHDIPKIGAAAPRLLMSLNLFQENDTMLFFPTLKGDYRAFHVNYPNYFLSAESKALIGQDTYFRTEYVLGRVVYIEKQVVPPAPSGSPSNKLKKPLKATPKKEKVEEAQSLPPGTTYFLVSVTSINK